MDEIRAVASALPRTNEGLVRGNVKFRVGRIVYLAISRDGSTMGFAFPKDWRNALVESEPEKFSLPSEHDMRYHWVHVDLGAIDAERDARARRGRVGVHGAEPGRRRVRRSQRLLLMRPRGCIRPKYAFRPMYAEPSRC